MKRLSRAAIAGAVLATTLGVFSGTAYATDACNNGEPSDRTIIEIENVVRLGLDDGSSGLEGVYVVCIGLLGDDEYTQVGGGLNPTGPNSYQIIVCLPDCNAIP